VLSKFSTTALRVSPSILGRAISPRIIRFISGMAEEKGVSSLFNAVQLDVKELTVHSSSYRRDRREWAIPSG